MSKTTELLKKYKTTNTQEKAEIALIIQAEQKLGSLLSRENKFAHFTASAFVVNKSRTKILCVYHNIYKSWTWVGGHADGIDDMALVAKKELTEETSIKNFKLISKKPIAVQILPVKTHYRNGEFVPTHLHFDLAFLFEADENDKVKINKKENSKVKWLKFKTLIKKTKEPFMIPVYEKIISKL